MKESGPLSLVKTCCGLSEICCNDLRKSYLTEKSPDDHHMWKWSDSRPLWYFLTWGWSRRIHRMGISRGFTTRKAKTPANQSFCGHREATKIMDRFILEKTHLRRSPHWCSKYLPSMPWDPEWKTHKKLCTGSCSTKVCVWTTAHLANGIEHQEKKRPLHGKDPVWTAQLIGWNILLSWNVPYCDNDHMQLQPFNDLLRQTAHLPRNCATHILRWAITVVLSLIRVTDSVILGRMAFKAIWIALISKLMWSFFSDNHFPAEIRSRRCTQNQSSLY